MRLLLLVSALALSACGPSAGSIEQRIADGLPRQIGPAERYDVQVENVQLARRTLGAVTILGEGVRPERGGPRLDRMTLRLDGVRMRPNGREVERVERARGTAYILPADLAAFLERNDAVRQAQVQFTAPDVVSVRLRPDVEGLTLPAGISVDVQGRFVADGGAVRFDVENVRALGASLGERAVERVSQAINPVVDLAGTPADVTVERVAVEDGRLVVQATGRVENLRLR